MYIYIIYVYIYMVKQQTFLCHVPMSCGPRQSTISARWWFLVMCVGLYPPTIYS